MRVLSFRRRRAKCISIIPTRYKQMDIGLNLTLGHFYNYRIIQSGNWTYYSLQLNDGWFQMSHDDFKSYFITIEELRENLIVEILK